MAAHRGCLVVAGSLFLYAWWNPVYLRPIGSSVLVNDGLELLLPLVGR